MFILRKIGSLDRPTSPPSNFILGKSYTYYNKEMHPKEFSEFDRKVIDELPLVDEGAKVYSYVFDENGNYFPLWTNERNFIMTDKGNTFENLSYR